jgi:hypothetical protein
MSTTPHAELASTEHANQSYRGTRTEHLAREQMADAKCSFMGCKEKVVEIRRSFTGRRLEVRGSCAKHITAPDRTDIVALTAKREALRGNNVTADTLSGARERLRRLPRRSE